jgi:hypothetical protein
MIRTISGFDKTLTADPPNVVTVTSAAAVTVLPDITGNIGEYESRMVQNVSPGPVFFSFGSDASPQSFHGILSQYGQLNCNAQKLSMIAQSTDVAVATITYRRNDLVNYGGGATPQ